MDRDDDQLRRNIGTLWRTAMVGLGTVREVVVRSTQSGKIRFDIALLQRERAQNLEQLGELVMQLVDHGEIDAPESLRQLCEHIRDIEGRIRSDSARASDNAFGAPRGYEPEAAVDYGDENELSDGGEIGNGATLDAAPAPKSTKTRAKKPAAKRKPNSGTRRKGTT